MINLHQASSPKISLSDDQFAKCFPGVNFTTSFPPLFPPAYNLGLADIHLVCFKIQMPRTSDSEDVFF